MLVTAFNTQHRIWNVLIPCPGRNFILCVHVFEKYRPKNRKMAVKFCISKDGVHLC